MANHNKKNVDKIDDYHWHEALDRTQIVLHHFEGAVCEHDVVTQNPELASLAEAASDALAELYQRIGQLRPDDH